MGVDVYLEWDGMSEDDKNLQYSGFDVTVGKYGYLRGAYNGHMGYDAICDLFNDFDWDNPIEVDIDILTKNLEELEEGMFKEFNDEFFSKDGEDLEIQSYRDFVALAIKLKKEGKNPIIKISY